jgi:hypothetical protein
MPFVIMRSTMDTYTLTLDGVVGTTRLSGLRFELAAMLAAHPKQIELRVLASTCIDGAGWGLLQAFFDVFWARGGHLIVSREGDAPVPVYDPSKLKRLLVASITPPQ